MDTGFRRDAGSTNSTYVNQDKQRIDQKCLDDGEIWFFSHQYHISLVALLQHLQHGKCENTRGQQLVVD